jgi:phage protein D
MSAIFYCINIQGMDMSDLLTEIKVEESDTQADLATLQFTDSELVLQDILQEGLSIEIDMGRADAHALLFRGVITHVRPSLASEGEPKLEVEAMNSLIKLALRPKTRRWNTTVSQIVRNIAQDNGLRPGRIEPEDDADISERQPRHQQEETDLAFLFRLAQDYGSRLYIGYEDVADTLNFVATSKLLEDAPLNQPLVFNDNVEDFSASADSFAAVTAPSLVITDPTTGEPDSVETAAVASAEGRHTPDANRIARLTEGVARVTQMVALTAANRERPEEARQSPARMLGNPSRPVTDRSGTYGDRTRTLGHRAEGRTTGNIWLQPRRRVRFEGQGGRWSGLWYVAEVEHQLDIAQRRYTTSFTCTR